MNDEPQRDETLEPRKMGKVYFDHALIEEVLTASRNSFIRTNCPQDLKVLAAKQDEIDLENRRVCLFVESAESDWPYVKPGEDIPILAPFFYEVVGEEKE